MKKNAYLIFGVLIFLAAIDLGLGSSYDWIMTKVSEALRPPKVIVTEPSDIYLYGYKANADTRIIDGRLNYPFRSNSLGFRDERVRDVSKASTKYRAIFIGDSFTEGFGVDYEKTFVHLIDAATPGIETLNAAVDSYSPAVYYAKIRHLLENDLVKFDELVVFLDLSDMVDNLKRHVGADGKVRVEDGTEKFANWQNDVAEIKPDPAPTSTPAREDFWRGVRHFLRYHSLTVRFLYKVREKMNAVRGGCSLVNSECSQDVVAKERTAADLKAYYASYLGMWMAGMWPIDERLRKTLGEPGLEHAAAQMDRLRELLAEHDIRMTLTVYPWPYQLLEGDKDSLQVRYWGAWAARHGVRFVNLFPPFFELPAVEAIKKYFLTGDVHWNEFGHAVVAKEFLKQWPRHDKSKPVQ